MSEIWRTVMRMTGPEAYYVTRYALFGVLFIVAGISRLWERTPWARRKEAARKAASEAHIRALVHRHMFGRAEEEVPEDGSRD
jgi:hypothetical protein